MHFSTCFTSPEKRMPPLLNFSFLAEVLFPRLCRLQERLNLINPDAVNENRLAAAFFVFNFMEIHTYRI